MRELAMFGEPEAELDPITGFGGSLEQPAEGAGRDLQIWILQTSARHADAVEHAVGLEPDRAGDLDIVAQTGAPDEVGHETGSGTSVPNCKQNCPERSN